MKVDRSPYHAKVALLFCCVIIQGANPIIQPFTTLQPKPLAFVTVVEIPSSHHFAFNCCCHVINFLCYRFARKTDYTVVHCSVICGDGVFYATLFEETTVAISLSSCAADISIACANCFALKRFVSNKRWLHPENKS